MYHQSTVIITIFAFAVTMALIFIRPKNMNEAIPATAGAILVFLSGSVSMGDLLDISSKVTGAAITIIATIVMAIVLESFGFFSWTAALMLKLSKGSGYRLFWNTLLLCFLMTLFFNNDGSILITTPILILILNNLKLKNRQKIPFLLSGALIATASSAPIGVSNIVNLIALKIIGMDLYMQTEMMFVPGVLGLLFLSYLLYLVFKKDIPKEIGFHSYSIPLQKNRPFHPLQKNSENLFHQQKKLMINMLIFVFLVRISLFVASFIGISVSLVAVCGSIILLIWRWIYLKVNPKDVVGKIPWHILIFAFSMYVIIFGLHNIGLTSILVDNLKSLVHDSLLHASLTMGIITAFLSNIFNNHPALMISTLALTDMGLDPLIMKTVYLANIIGSDIGSLILPIGTLATLIWMHILKKNKIKITWVEYMKVTLLVIPPTLIFTLISLYLWLLLVFVP
ncbi:arsenic transporter [Neobacillus sp. MM2021_6]|uniref:arsenic transporter n=1 Tax=Bacillaceae TaxID=186817 RepID=UPI00140DAA9F|nr:MULTISPECIES: arsenic transporter [Bacillaceae]MBO0960216.1 arsenic transporter [Neobacillus sp. MM2021_6]NHC18553.1 arsenic transporter [Bacillus sp. MM2020_4]WML39805.1 arsenic transporter [Neobacillus sp. OS1-2]